MSKRKAINEFHESEPLLGAGEVEKNIKPQDGAQELTVLGCTINMIKCCVGAGSFSLPFAFYTSGLYAGIAGCIVLGLLSAYTMIILADAEKYVVNRDGRTNRLTYPEVAAALFPNACVNGVNVVKALVYMLLCLTSLGVTGAYAVFISTTMADVVPLNYWELLLVIFPICLALALLRSFKILAFTSILGDIAVSVGFVATLVYAIRNHHIDMESLPSIKWEGVPPAMGNLAFLFLSHIVTLPMAQSLGRDLEEPTRFHRVVNYSYVFIIVVNLVFGALCYLYFGLSTEDNVIKNLSTGTILQIVRVFLSVDLLFTVPMILAVGREIVENSVLTWTCTKSHDTLTRNIVRFCLVVILIALAYAIIKSGGNEAFGNVVTLVGGICNFSLGFILPPIFHIKVHSFRRLGMLRSVFLVFIIALGVLMLVGSTYFTVSGMI